jgi:hypothetical protein
MQLVLILLLKEFQSKLKESQLLLVSSVSIAFGIFWILPIFPAVPFLLLNFMHDLVFLCAGHGIIPTIIIPSRFYFSIMVLLMN